MSAPELRSIEVREGVSPVYYYRHGSGQPLLYLHHLAGMQGWEPAMAALSEQFDVIAPYHPGWGPSAGLEELESPLDLVLHYQDFMNALGIQSAFVFGHSLGAWIAAELAAVLPARVKRLVLANPVGIWEESIGGEDPFAQHPTMATGVFLADPSRRQELIVAGADPTDHYVQEMKDLKAAAKFLWPIPDTGVSRRLRRINAPTLVLAGEEDRFIPPAYAKVWQELIPGARVERIAGAGHLLNLEQPQELAAKAAGFLAA